MDQHSSESCYKLFESHFSFERPVALLLYLVSSVPNGSISIRTYWAELNIKIEKNLKGAKI